MGKILNKHVAVIAAVIIVMVYREPSLFSSPRFWAEEGSIYFFEAFHSPWYQALFSAHRGYYSLFPNFATLLAARAVPLENAPLVTVIASFLAQLLPFVLVMFRLEGTLRPVQQILLCLVIVFVAQMGVVWLNTITTQYHFAIVVFLILIAGHERVSHGWTIADRVLVAVCGLTGVIACFLLPVFIMRWLRERNRNLLVLTLILGFASVVQLFFMMFSQSDAPNRFVAPEGYLIAAFWARDSLVLPVLGFRSGQALVPGPLALAAATAILTAAFIVAIRSSRRESILVLASFLIVSVLSLLGSLWMAGGWRYAYAPGVILMSLFVINGVDGQYRLVRIVSLFIVVLSLASWVPAYHRALEHWVNPNWPRWSEEVRMWRETPERPLRIWPQWRGAQWTVSLRSPE
jgi:hypothetical protein